jgi:F420H(2)-dependent quinone reductase
MGREFWTAPVFSRIRHRMGNPRALSVATTRVHAVAIRLSGGRLRRSLLFAGGMDVLVLTTVGRRSGRARSTPLAYLPHGTALAVVATNGGQDRVPDWWLNLQAEPLASVLVGGERLAVRARRASLDEDRELWDTFIRVNRGFAEYRKLTAREIPIVLLEPAPSHS